MKLEDIINRLAGELGLSQEELYDRLSPLFVSRSDIDKIAEERGWTPEQGAQYKKVLSEVVELATTTLSPSIPTLEEDTVEKREQIAYTIMRLLAENVESLFDTAEAQVEKRTARQHIQRTYQHLKEEYERTRDWEAVYNIEEPLDPIYFSVAWVRLAGEITGQPIESSEQLKKLTGQDRYLEGDGDIGELFTIARAYEYSQHLEELLRQGGKYKDLLAVEPSQFGLPNEGWVGAYSKESNKARAILQAINAVYCKPLEDCCSWFTGAFKASNRDIADTIEAPLSVIREATKYWENY